MAGPARRRPSGIERAWYLLDAGAGPGTPASSRRLRRRLLGFLLAAAWALFALIAPRILLHPTTGGPASATPSPAGSPATVTCEHGNRRDAFRLDSDGTLFHRATAAEGGGWPDWTPLGRKQLLTAAVTTGGDGAIWIFGVAEDETIWYLFQEVPSGLWSTWFPLSGTTLTSVAMAGDAGGRITPFGLTTAQRQGDQTPCHF